MIRRAIRLVWSAIRYGEWDARWATRKTWPGKPYLAVLSGFYDGHYLALHLGPFYVGVAYVW